MRGLLYKECKLLWQCGKYFLPMILLSSIWLFEEFRLGMVQNLFISALPLLNFFPEEDQRWDAYAGTLPVSPGRIVGARYLLAAGLVLSCSAFCMFLGWFQCTDRAEFWEETRAVLCIGLMIPALCAPALYRWGVLRGTAANIVVCMFSYGVIRLWNRVMPLGIGEVCFWLQPGLYAGSWYLSAKWYGKREF